MLWIASNPSDPHRLSLLQTSEYMATLPMHLVYGNLKFRFLELCEAKRVPDFKVSTHMNLYFKMKTKTLIVLYLLQRRDAAPNS